MSSQTKEYRQQIVDAFIKSLEKDPERWKKEWQGTGTVPMNGNTNRNYTGLNRLFLQFTMFEKGWEDPRFYTFKQVQDMGLKVEKGSKATKVEFWSFYYPDEKRKVSYKEAAELQRDGKEIRPLARYYSIFNAAQIEGIDPYEQKKFSDAERNEILETISRNMNVPIVHDGGDRAFYKPLEDKIHLPVPEAFFSQEAYNATALHELAHATGAEHRLDRDINNFFGSEKYVREELVAEITSCFCAAELGLDGNASHFENHTAYVRGWIDEIKEKPEALMQAIKDADKATSYLYDAAEISRIREKEVDTREIDYKAESEKRMRISHIPEISFDEFVMKKGYSVGDLPQEDDYVKLALGGTGGVTMRQESEMKKAARRIALRKALHEEYKELLNQGIIGKREVKTELDPERESDRAYIRMQIKREEADKATSYLHDAAEILRIREKEVTKEEKEITPKSIERHEEEFEV